MGKTTTSSGSKLGRGETGLNWNTEATEQIQLANQAQFKHLEKIFSEFYQMKDPGDGKYDDIKKLFQRLSASRVLKVEVIENEHLKIKKENQGKGCQLDTNIILNDPQMKLFFQYLNKQFISINREDKYMAFRYKNFTRKE